MSKVIWDYLYSWLGNEYGTAGLMGNLYAESALNPINLQNSANTRLGLTDEQYTAKVDNGSYRNFVMDSAGYGLAQWTYWSRKQALLDYAKSKGKSIGDLNMQLDFLKRELNENYSSLVKELKSATSILAASNAVLMKFERPADQSTSVQNARASYGKTYYDKYRKGNAEMAYYLGQASHDERGDYYYGAAGDQTGTEVAISKFYSYPWNVVLRPKDAELARKSANSMIDACSNDRGFGYDMGQRNTAYAEWVKVGKIANITKACEVDCSSLVSLCITEAGLDILSGRSNAPVTSNLRSVLLGTGKYEALTGSLLTDASKLKRGDVLLSEGHHTAIFLGTSKEKVEDAEQPKNDFGIYYQAHVQKYGWMDKKHDGLTAGTVGESKRMEALKVTCPKAKDGEPQMKVSGKAHIEGIGWVDVPEAEEIILGTTGESRRLESVELTFTNVPKDKKVYYQAHCASIGWQAKVENGFPVGTTGMKKSIEAFKIWCI